MQRNKTWFPRSLCLWRESSADTQLTVPLGRILGAQNGVKRRDWRKIPVREGRMEEVMPELGFEGYLEFQQMNVDFLNKDTVTRHV